MIIDLSKNLTHRIITLILLIMSLITLPVLTGCQRVPVPITTKTDTPTETAPKQPTATDTYYPTYDSQPTSTSTEEPTKTHPTITSEATISLVKTQPVLKVPTLSPSNLDCLSVGIPIEACTGVVSNLEWQPIIKTINGFPMALVPAGCFIMGNNAGFAEEQPAHGQCIQQPFWVDITEVTVEQYTRYMNENNCTVDKIPIWVNVYGEESIQIIKKDGLWEPKPGEKGHPLESVNYIIATDYCAWRGGRLLTEAEWEYAARGPDGWLYPWGNDFIADNVVRIYDKVPSAGSKPAGASWVGALDMSSSLFEWVSSIYRPYPFDAQDGRESPLEDDNYSQRVLRGVAWYHPDGMQDNLTATTRIDNPPSRQVWYFGFRCAYDIDQ